METQPWALEKGCPQAGEMSGPVHPTGLGQDREGDLICLVKKLPDPWL